MKCGLLQIRFKILSITYRYRTLYEFSNEQKNCTANGLRKSINYNTNTYLLQKLKKIYLQTFINRIKFDYLCDVIYNFYLTI